MQSPGRSSCTIFPAILYIVDGVRTGVPYSEQQVIVSYDTFKCVPPSYPGYNEVIDEVPHLTKGEMLWFRKADDNGALKCYRVRAEPKPGALLTELIRWFPQPEDILADISLRVSSPQLWHLYRWTNIGTSSAVNRIPSAFLTQRTA